MPSLSPRSGFPEVPPDRRGIDDEDRDAREAEEVRPGVPRWSGPDRRGDEEADRGSGPGPRGQRGTLGNWVQRARADRGDRGELREGQFEELKRLRQEVAELRMERDVLIGRVRARVRARRSRRLVM